MKRYIFFGLLFLGLGLGALRAEAYSFDWGFLASKQENLNGETRITALGPFFEYVKSPAGQVYWGFRPFYAKVEEPKRSRSRDFYLWPLGSTTRYLNEFKWRMLIAYGRVGHPGVTNTPAYRFNIFPVYFQSRNNDGRLAVAVFPLGGTIQNFVWYDRVSFVLFPLWVRWEAQDVKSDNFLWPVFAKTQSEDDEDIDRKRVWPFYMRSSKKDVYYKKSVMWPFWSWARYYTEGSKGYSWILFPLCGQLNREGQKGFWLIPPFFRFQWGENGKMIYAPWPFVQYRSTKYMRKFAVWPLYGYRRVGPLVNQYFLWPLIWHRTIEFDKSYVKGSQFIPFIIWDRMFKKNADGSLGEVTRRYNKVWPLVSYRRKGKLRQTRVFEFWPFREDLGVAQTWAPLWTLFSHTVEEGKGYESELLWGLYRQQRIGRERRYNQLFPLYSYERDERIDGGKKEWSFLKGLIGYKREHGIRRYRLLYFITFGGKRAEH